MALIITTAPIVAYARQPWAGLLAGPGLLAHAAWDSHHHRARRVVPRSMAEFCAVLDTLLGATIIAAALLS